MAKKLLLALISLCSLSLSAQLETSADYKRQVYDREYTLGLIGHSRGYAINGRYAKFLDGYHKQGLEIDLVKLRHPKEVKMPSQIYPNSRGYVYNRVNTFYTMRVGYLREKILFDKTDKGTVAISLIYSGGLSLGLLKPVYVQIITNDSGFLGNLKTVRYNPSDPKQSIIVGEANFFRGVGETKVRPGAYAKLGVNFDYQLLEKKVTALEVGVAFDHFFTEVPIFYEASGEDVNWAGFFQMYVALNFGYRKN